MFLASVINAKVHLASSLVCRWITCRGKKDSVNETVGAVRKRQFYPAMICLKFVAQK